MAILSLKVAGERFTYYMAAQLDNKKNQTLTRMMNIITRLRSASLQSIASIAAVGVFTLAVVTSVALSGRDRMAVAETAEVMDTTNNPTELSAADKGLYLSIFALQNNKEYARADQMINQLGNRYLVGYVLAERYLDANYRATNDELALWLKLYSDQPQAAQIASLATRRGMDVTLPAQEKPLRGEGYTDHMGRSGMPDSWYTALNFWREGNAAQAKIIFAKLSENEDLSDWQRSAAYYWNYRANDKLGESEAAHASLKNAAQYATTFYGLLAGEQLDKLNIAAEAPEVSTALRNDPRAIRAALLTALDRTDDAEDELRQLYSATDKRTRGGIVTLASELGLSNLQMRLARTDGLSPSEALFARYPVPQYMVALHPVMDSALLLAVARNESGFREIAKSPSGAVGMMQMLPSTARALERRIGQDQLSEASASASLAPIAERLSDPALSARYGAEYLKLLCKENAINNSLIHLLVGYNAGPGTVASWNNAARKVSDPLLYIESIPYAETRNYVMQVSAQYWIYQLMMDETPTSLRTLAKGQWPQLPRSGA